MFAVYYLKAVNTGQTVAGINGNKGTFDLQYLINPDETITQLTNSDEDKEFIERLFSPVRSLFTKTNNANVNRARTVFGDSNFSPWVRIVDYAFATNPESFDVAPLGARGRSSATANAGGIQLTLFNTGSIRDGSSGAFPTTPIVTGKHQNFRDL